MKQLLIDFFGELGFHQTVTWVKSTTSLSSLRIYYRILEREINQPNLIVSNERAAEMKRQFYEEWNKINESDYRV